MKIEAHRKILFLAIVLVLLSPLPAYAACGGGSFSDFKLTAGIPVLNAQFGHSVAVSGDTMVVGAPYEHAAYVFEYDGSTWSQVAKLTPGSTSFSLFGYSVAISGDTVVVGDPFPYFGGNLVYVFKRVSDSWDEYDPDNEDYSPLILNTGALTFGWSLAFDGSTLVVGTNWTNLVYVFNPDGDNWPLEATLTASDLESTDRFGWSVAVSGDRVVVGAPWDNIDVQDPDDADGTIMLQSAGSAYVFEFDGNSWLEKKPKLTAEDPAAFDLFGFSVAIHNDTVVVGARKDSSNLDPPAAIYGEVYVFEFDGKSWLEEATLTASDLPDPDDDDEFGYSVAIKDSTLLVGAPNDTDKLGNITGTAYLFKYDGSNWVKVEDPFEPALEEGDKFGWSVATDGSTIAVGAPLSNLEVPDQTDVDLNNEVLKAGAAYVFTPNETPASVVYSTFGKSRHRLHWHKYSFYGHEDEQVTIRLEADPKSWHRGRRATLILKDKIKGYRLFQTNKDSLYNDISATLPADGKYTVYVLNQPRFWRRHKRHKRFEDDYILTLEGTCGKLVKGSQRNKR